MSTTRLFYVVMAIKAWEDLKLTAHGFPFQARLARPDDDGCIGFLPVFETREAAEAYRAGHDALIFTIREVQKEVPA
ncbi:MAG: hypothetical protein ACYDC2_11785 [Solirubrobacteraceae bacterium]